MTTSDALRHTKIHLAHGSGAIPAVGFGTLIPDPIATRQATKDRHWKSDFDISIARNGTAMKKRSVMRCRQCSRRARFGAKTCSSPRSCGTPIIARSGSSPPSRRACRRLQLDYLDCYLIHTPFAFQPGDDQDPRDERGQVIYGFRGDAGRNVASDGGAGGRRPVQGDRSVGRHPRKSCARSSPLRGSSRPSCKSNRIRISLNGNCSISAASKASCCWRSPRWDTASTPNLLEDQVITSDSQRAAQNPRPGRAGLGRTARHRFPRPPRPTRAASQENFEISRLPRRRHAGDQRNSITTNIRFNSVVGTGVPASFPRVS